MKQILLLLCLSVGLSASAKKPTSRATAKAVHRMERLEKRIRTLEVLEVGMLGTAAAVPYAVVGAVPAVPVVFVYHFLSNRAYRKLQRALTAKAHVD